jgi:hypothetical protein
MKINYKKTNLRFVLSQVVLLCLFMALGSSKAFAQCTYVTIENGKETKISIPCDFPVLLSSNKPEQDRNNFNTELEKWYSNNPTLKNIILTPMSHPSDQFIEIPFSSYTQFDASKKKMVDAISYFYKVTEKN